LYYYPFISSRRRAELALPFADCRYVGQDGILRPIGNRPGRAKFPIPFHYGPAVALALRFPLR